MKSLSFFGNSFLLRPCDKSLTVFTFSSFWSSDHYIGTDILFRVVALPRSDENKNYQHMLKRNPMTHRVFIELLISICLNALTKVSSLNLLYVYLERWMMDQYPQLNELRHIWRGQYRAPNCWLFHCTMTQVEPNHMVKWKEYREHTTRQSNTAMNSYWRLWLL